jgi:hypothetical protein
MKDPSARMNINQFLLTPPITQRVTLLPSQYRPKYLEERLRRYHVKQMINQLDRLGISSSTPQQLQSKSLTSTPGGGNDRGGVNGTNRLNPLGEDEELMFMSSTSRYSTQDQHHVSLTIDVNESQSHSHEEETKVLYDDISNTTGSLGMSVDPSVPGGVLRDDALVYLEPKDGMRSPILPALSLASNGVGGCSGVGFSTKENNLSKTSSLTTSEVNTPLSINMKTIRMIPSHHHSSDHRDRDGFHHPHSSSHDDHMNKYSSIGPIESASNYLKKHLQNQQDQLLLNITDSLDNVCAGLDLDDGPLLTATASSNSVMITSTMSEPTMKISPRALLTSLTTPSSNTLALATSASLNNLPSAAVATILPLTSQSSRGPLLAVTKLDPVIIPTIVHQPSSSSTSSTSPTLTHTITSLPPLRRDSTSSLNGDGTRTRPSSSSDGPLKSSRREKKSRVEDPALDHSSPSPHTPRTVVLVSSAIDTSTEVPHVAVGSPPHPIAPSVTIEDETKELPSSPSPSTVLVAAASATATAATVIEESI